MAVAIDHLGDDVTKNILSRLQVETLVQCKVVSKRWKELATEVAEKRKEKTKGFILVNFVSTPVPGMYVPRYSYASPESDVYDVNLDVDEYIPVNHYTIRDCCNGAVLCIGTSYPPNEDGDPDPEQHSVANYYVCNPVTQKWAKLPESPATNPDQHDVLAFDPALWPGPQYKVLRWFRTPQQNNKHVELDLYSSRTRTWSRRQIPLRRGKVTFSRGGLCSSFIVFIRGFLFRLADPNVIVALDVSDDRIPPAQIINHPFQKNDKPTHRGLAKWGDSLCYIDYNKTRIEMWAMEDFPARRSWVMKRAMSVDRMVNSNPRTSRMENPFLPVTLHGEREEILLETPEGVGRFSLRTSRCEEMYPIDYVMRTTLPFRDIVAYPFSASFHSPRIINHPPS